MKLLAGSFAALFLSLSAQAADCTFTQLEIVPQFGSPNMFGGEPNWGTISSNARANPSTAARRS